MHWYLRSKIFIESVINLSVCEADLFINSQVQRELGDHRSNTIYQAFDEQTPMTFSSLERMLLDYLQPSAVQLLGNLHECIRRCFDSSGSHVATSSPNIQPTILRFSQSYDDSDDEASPRLARKMRPASNGSNQTCTTVPNVLSTPECPSFPPVATPSHADASELVAVPNTLVSCSEPDTTALCVVEYIASVQRRWLAPSIVPYCMKFHNGLASHVSGIVKSNGLYEYVFCPCVILPDTCSDSMIFFPKASMLLTDCKGKRLDARELDCFKMDPRSSNARKTSNLIKNQVYRNTGYSIKVRQYFLQIDSSILADTYVLWWYTDDSGRSFCSIFSLTKSCCYHAHCCFYRRLLPYTSEHSQKLELEWGRFVSAGTNEMFMLQDVPGEKCQINFLQMSQQNTDVSIFALVFRLLLSFIHSADRKLPIHCAH